MSTTTLNALVIEPNGRSYVKEIPRSGQPGSLEARQEVVGGYIEAFPVETTDGKKSACMYLNEEGKYTIGPDGYNGLATDLVRHLLQFGDWICGTVVIVGNGQMGHDADVPEWVVKKVKAFPDCRWSDQ